ncbi:helicase [Fibrobacterales bacterium]|nr:helicase [Fibrobacterales bacterium]
MLLDNENQNLKIHEWIAKYTQTGQMSVVTGYFTVGALTYLAEKTQDKINAYKFILGDIVNVENKEVRTLDLLNENIEVDAALWLSKVAREAVEFLKLDKVEVKTLEPNFCHAKLYLYNDQADERHHYYISGSSNLTEAGMGLKITNNVELNIGDTGNDDQYKNLSIWFKNLWDLPQAHKEKTIVIVENGKKKEKKIDFKKYLIEEIGKIFKEYSPKELYYKVLFELFEQDISAENNDPKFNKQIGRLENTVIYGALYEFQKKGALSLIKMLERHNGAILADAVGLGKTWTALAVMKFYQLQGREVILLCPKKLNHNWEQYLKRHHSKFEKDEFDYLVEWHTSLNEDLLGKQTGTHKKFFTNPKPKLFVIDESHNLRNHKSKRYQFLENVLAKNEDCKVLMLSATPINNTLLDIRNQFKLIVKGKENGFAETLEIKNLDYLFTKAQAEFNKWSAKKNANIEELIQRLHSDFFKLTDSLTVARTRKMIEGLQNNLVFPQKEKPENIFETPRQIGSFETFEKLLENFPPMMSGYQPAYYVKYEEKKTVIHDEKLRQHFLVKMMYILMMKRLESSWFSFQSTVDKILKHHQNVLDKLFEYQKNKRNVNLGDGEIDFGEDDDTQNEFENELDELSLGKKSPISIFEIDKAGNVEKYKADLKKDIEKLQILKLNLNVFADKIKKEKTKESADTKLQILIDRIVKKQARNDGNKKVLIFSVYRDTAVYLFDELSRRGFKNLAYVSGGSSKVWNEQETKNFESILERFAPYTKLYNEKEWTEFESSCHRGLDPQSKFEEWKKWIKTNDKEKETHSKLQNPIDILVATDVLSEGQNLQDCDMVVNYDIHWNPVRVIQRMGRIDRLGSPNKKIFGINFWPSDNINAYLNLQNRIEQRMATMTLAGSEVNLNFSDSFKEKAENNKLEQQQKDRMLKQMETSFDDIETGKSFGFDNLSLESFRQDLLNELKEKEKIYQQMPNGVYTGFKITSENCPNEGIIALLKYKDKSVAKPYELVYIDKTGKSILSNQKEVLAALATHKDEVRFVSEEIDDGDEQAVKMYVKALSNWITSQAESAANSEIQNIFAGNGGVSADFNTSIKTEDKFQAKNFDLITWFVVTG